MDSRKINVGVIGANIHQGWGGGVHLPALLRLPEYRVVALCTSSRETAEESAKTLQCSDGFSRLPEDG